MVISICWKASQADVAATQHRQEIVRVLHIGPADKKTSCSLTLLQFYSILSRSLKPKNTKSFSEGQLHKSQQLLSFGVIRASRKSCEHGLRCRVRCRDMKIDCAYTFNSIQFTANKSTRAAADQRRDINIKADCIESNEESRNI